MERTVRISSTTDPFLTAVGKKKKYRAKNEGLELLCYHCFQDDFRSPLHPYGNGTFHCPKHGTLDFRLADPPEDLRKRLKESQENLKRLEQKMATMSPVRKADTLDDDVFREVAISVDGLTEAQLLQTFPMHPNGMTELLQRLRVQGLIGAHNTYAGEPYTWKLDGPGRAEADKRGWFKLPAHPTTFSAKEEQSILQLLAKCNSPVDSCI